MPEDTVHPKTNSVPSNDTPSAHPYPSPDADNGEEQRNRLGYMATEPTEEEIEGGETEEDEMAPTSPAAPPEG